MSKQLGKEDFLRTFFDTNVKAILERVEINYDNYAEEFLKAFSIAEKNYNSSPIYSLFPADSELIRQIKDESYQACIKRLYIQPLSNDIVGISDKKHKNWLNEKRDSIKWKQRDHFYNYLRQSFSKESIDYIDSLSDIIIDHLEDPQRDEPISVKGLIMGEAQSGKTNLFTAICHKAIDVGWRFIIILAGMTNDLRVQTQKRMCKDLIGLSLDSTATSQKCGIGEYQKNYDTDSADFINLTKVDSDFSKDSTSNNLKKYVKDQKRNFVHIAIIKKNSTILHNLLEWLGLSDPNINQDRKEIAKSLPCLIIDDEADQASPNGAEDKGEITKINGQIRDLLQVFDKSAYLAVTATPYANIFINPQLDFEDGEEKLQDLFPSNFIYIKESPREYIGISELFGPGNDDNYNEISEQVIVTIPSDENELFKDPIKKGDKITYIPPSLESAIRYFICCCVYKDLTFNSHSTMMVHVDYRTGNQNDLSVLIQSFLEKEVNFIQNYQGESENRIKNDKIYLDYMNLWEQGVQNNGVKKKAPTFAELSGKRFYDVWRSNLYKSAEQLFVKVVNSDGDGQSLVSLYEKNKNLRMITVGGYALARGVTLEGLCVTYLSRRAGTIDTLVQMGRFFGYRLDCLPYMKIWTTDKIIELFTDACVAQTEFIKQVKEMNEADKTPEEFGYRIHKSPSNLKLRIAAKNKMFHSSIVTLDMELAGHAFQSSKLPASIEELEKNRKLVSEFLKDLGEYKYSEPWNEYYWENISSEKVADLISDFSAYSWGEANKVLITKYIRQKMNHKKWQVRLVSKNKNKAPEFIRENMFDLDTGGNKIGYTESKLFEKQLSGEKFLSFSKGAIMSGSDLGRYLKDQNGGSLPKFIQQMFEEKNSKKYSATDILRYEWDKAPGQLLIYSIAPNFTDKSQTELNEKYKKGFCALVVGIPAESDDYKASIKGEFYVNDVFLMNTKDWS